MIGDKPLKVGTPFAEDFFFDPTQANALGYRFSALRGNKVEISVEIDAADSLDIFLDVFRIDNDSLGQYTHIASAAEKGQVLDFEPLVDAEYILRLQSELLRGGMFRIEIQRVPSMSFPVKGRGNSDIGSLFGVPRDGGRRKHHGVDIFARRHTPIVAPTEGRITRVDETEIGGRVVWLRDTKRNQAVYFAHLQDILVNQGEYVYPGDTLGTVGNTGNARTTPPHLHFGIYKNGPIDPYNFIAETRTRLKRELSDKSLIGQTIRSKKNARLSLNGMGRKSEKLTLPQFQIMEAIGTSAAYYRVRLPDQTEGYIYYADVEGAEKPIRRTTIGEDIAVLTKPNDSAFKVDQLPGGERVNVLGGNDDFIYIERTSGQKGWVSGR